MAILSQHPCKSWLEGYLFTWRHPAQAGDKGIYLKRQLKHTLIEHKQVIDK